MSIQDRDYREIIRRAFRERRRANPNYSLRAFARDLRMTPGQLSQILNGKRGLSHLAAVRTARTIGLNEREVEYFCCLVESVHARSKATRVSAQLRLEKFTPREPFVRLQLDTFQVVSDWYHFAILKLMETSDYRQDLHWIAKQLGIRSAEVQEALKRLERLKLIKLSRDGDYVLSQKMVFAPDDIPSEAIQKFHRQVIEKALQALAHQPLMERYFNTTLLPIARAELPSAKLAIKKFHAKFTREFSPPNQTFDQVYCLAVQFFGISRKIPGESE